ncbi:MAG TPA: hypothetical protein ENJ79_01460 [Gammaproteobacteria bacterium]|nr:hypothetical protein [Gammaproteobacteria bacterium]
MPEEYWFPDETWSAHEQPCRKKHGGERRVDVRRVINGIIHVLEPSCRWKDCRRAFGPATPDRGRARRGRNRIERAFPASRISGASPHDMTS